MSVWHETQIEFACDAADELIAVYGADPEITKIRETLNEAYAVAEDLPDDNKAESIHLLTRSIQLLKKAHKQVPFGDEKVLRRLRNKIAKAQEANQDTIIEIRNM